MDTLYCHFSFRRPKGEKFGMFSVAIYKDYDGTQHVCHDVDKRTLWEDNQFVAAVQSYEYALSKIYEWQGYMQNVGIKAVMLVTDNSTLAKWIQTKRRTGHASDYTDYAEYLERAVSKYRAGGVKEISIQVGLADVRKYEKSYKFCKLANIADKQNNKNIKLEPKKLKSVMDIMSEATVEVNGVHAN